MSSGIAETMTIAGVFLDNKLDEKSRALQQRLTDHFMRRHYGADDPSLAGLSEEERTAAAHVISKLETVNPLDNLASGAGIVRALGESDDDLRARVNALIVKVSESL